ncbi:hypothetical protein BC830DRAFT_1091133 [Chytriomyces sp. MP71]|nr:hypothetical protein BC830DRAFT_1091133 [Chytriomyces sp. MP71]
MLSNSASDDASNPVPHVRRHGTLENALTQGGRIVDIKPHANNPSMTSICVRVPRSVYKPPAHDNEGRFVDMVFSNVSQDHVDRILAKEPPSSNQTLNHPTRAHGSLEEALKQGAELIEIHSHDHNNTFSVTARVPLSTQAPMEMIYTGISLELLQSLATVYPNVASALQAANLQLFHAPELVDLLKEDGTKISAWHPTAEGAYSVQVQCRDGCLRQFASVSEEQMMQWAPGFVVGSTFAPSV